MRNAHSISTTSTNIEISAMGIRFTGDVTREQWEEIGAQLATVARSLGFMLGDWLNYMTGNTTFQLEDRYAEAILLTGLDYNTLQRYSRVAARVPLDNRRECLSYDHHNIVAPLPPESRDYWLEQAAEQGMSTRRLRKSIAAGRVVDVAEMTKAPEVNRIETVNPLINRTVSLFGKWRQSGWIKRQTSEQLKRLRADLEPVRAICDELDALAEQKESFR